MKLVKRLSYCYTRTDGQTDMFKPIDTISQLLVLEQKEKLSCDVKLITAVQSVCSHFIDLAHVCALREEPWLYSALTVFLTPP
jgi:hypothetical protein